MPDDDRVDLHAGCPNKLHPLQSFMQQQNAALFSLFVTVGQFTQIASGGILIAADDLLPWGNIDGVFGNEQRGLRFGRKINRATGRNVFGRPCIFSCRKL